MASSSPRPGASKNALPYEQRGRMLWDPAYKAKMQAEYPSSDSESDGVSSDRPTYPTGPYVSGGVSSTQKTMTPSLGTRHPRRSGSGGGGGGVGGSAAGRGGFKPASYKAPQSSRIPRRGQFAFNKDNTAKAAFRKREPSSGEFVLPRDCHEIEPDRAKIYNFLEELGIRAGSFIRPPQYIRDRTLYLWGNTDQVKRTQAELQRWLSRVQIQTTHSISRAKEKFAEIHPIGGPVYQRIEREALIDVELRKYQQEPAKGTVFAYTGSFLWPTDKISPTDLLGNSLEALDPLRLTYRCYIIFDSRLSAFKLSTNKRNSIEQLLPRLQGIMQEYIARTSRLVVRYYVELSDPSIHRKEIRKVPSEAAVGSAIIPLLTGKRLEISEHNQWQRQVESSKAQSSQGIEDALLQTIPTLRYYRGQVRLRVHFGTFALTLFRWPGTVDSISFEDFVKNMAMSGTKGIMIRDLQVKKEAASVLEKIYGAHKLFLPIDNQAESLNDVVPSFSAYFECQDDKQPVKLEVETMSNASDPNLYDRTFALWSRLHRKTNPLDISMIRLDGCSSWQLQASTDNPVDRSRITLRMKAFAQSVMVKKGPLAKTRLGGDKVFSWDSSFGSMPVTAFVQKSSLRFRLTRNPEYIVEISRYDTYEDPSATAIRPQEANWGATLWNPEWDSELAANVGLGIGESAAWTPRLETFFPNPGQSTSGGGITPGLNEFLQIVGDVNNFLNEIK